MHSSDQVTFSATHGTIRHIMSAAIGIATVDGWPYEPQGHLYSQVPYFHRTMRAALKRQLVCRIIVLLHPGGRHGGA